MLGKLLKYEFRATGRILVIFYAALMIISVITRIEMAIDGGTMSQMSAFIPRMIVIMLYAMCVAAVFVLTFIIVIQRFYNNLLKNEGYLMHTLPVTTWQHITSKLIVSVVWSVAGIFVICVSGMIIGSNIVDIPEMLSDMFNIKWNGNYTGYLVELMILFIAYIAAFVMKLYLSMSIGQLFENHKMLFSFGAYIGISIVLHILNGIITNIGFSGGINISLNDFSRYNIAAGLHMAMIIMICMEVLKAAVFFAGTHYLLKNKLNLE
jgi:hypothetical protein